MSDVLVMTGATSGIGARALGKLLDARPNLTAFVLARRSEHTDEFIETLAAKSRVTFVWTDLADLAAVERACQQVIEDLSDRRITHLVLNAGVQAVGESQASKDGIEIAFAVNHLSHLLIIDQLDASLAPAARVVVTASEVHDPQAFCLVGITRAEWQDPEILADPVRSQSQYDEIVDRGEARYAISKLMNVMTARSIAAARPDLMVASFNPSVVPGTNIARERNALQILGWKFIMAPLARIIPGARSIEQSASDLVWLALQADAKAVTGQYVNGRVIEPGSAESRDPNKINRVMDVSRRILRAHRASGASASVP